MKRRTLVLLTALLVPALVTAGPEHAPTKAPAAFDRLKALVGEWEGAGSDAGKGSTSFRLVAHGSALVEMLAPMGDDPMVNVYHPDGDAVVMTHYCSSGNQPRMRCTKDGTSLEFKMTDITNWKKGEARMSGLTIVMVDADHMKQEWVSDENGKTESMTMEFVRKK